MPKPLRRLPLILVLLLVAPILAQDDKGRSEDAVTSGDENELPIHKRIHQPSLTACASCHPRVWEEWSQSLHHRAWTNANVRHATADFQRRSCRSCHSPEPVLPRGLDKRPLYRDYNQEDGVHCLSCHGREDGVAATRTIEGAPCRPIFDARLTGPNMCYPCHQPTHQAYDEYRQSDAFKVGIRCTDCHMPQREDAPGRSHGPHGGLNPSFVRKSVHWEAEILPEALKVTLRNRTGHRLPGEIPSRALILRVRFDDGEPEYLTLRRPAKGESRVDNRLRPDESREFLFELPLKAQKANLQILWKPFPLLPDEEAFNIGSWEGAVESS